MSLDLESGNAPDSRTARSDYAGSLTVESRGGDIRVDAEPKLGTRFYFTLPVTR